MCARRLLASGELHGAQKRLNIIDTHFGGVVAPQRVELARGETRSGHSGTSRVQATARAFHVTRFDNLRRASRCASQRSKVDAPSFSGKCDSSFCSNTFTPALPMNDRHNLTRYSQLAQDLPSVESTHDSRATPLPPPSTKRAVRHANVPANLSSRLRYKMWVEKINSSWDRKD
jgi:hypothetical protein